MKKEILKDKATIKQFDNVKFETYEINMTLDPPKLGEVEKALDKLNQVTLDRIRKAIDQKARPGIVVAYIHKLVMLNEHQAHQLFENDSKDTMEYKWKKQFKEKKK